MNDNRDNIADVADELETEFGDRLGVWRTSTGRWSEWRAACLERLATALAGYSDLAVALRADGPAPCLTVRNTAAPLMSETVAVRQQGDGPAFTWSWGARIGDASDPDTAAATVAYVLAVRDAARPRTRPTGR